MGDSLNIVALGGLTIRDNGKQVTGFVSRKAEALLVYLACTGREHPREVLADLLWNDRPQKQAMSNLRTVIANLRQRLEPYIDAPRTSIGLTGTYRVDVTDLEAGLSEASQQWSHNANLDQGAALRLEQTLNLYRGDFLEGFSIYDGSGFEDWMLQERERLRQQVIEALHHLIEGHLDYGNYQAGIAQATRLLQLDPLREEAHGQLMRLLGWTGQRSAALAQYETCRRLLDEELGVAPSPDIANLYEQIQAGTLIAPKTVIRPVMTDSPEPQHNLPQQATPFVGRASELEDLSERLLDPGCRLLTLVGPGGIGKTRLAVQAAANQVAQFADGVYFVPLAPLSTPESIIPTIAESVRFSFYPQGEPKQQLIDYLRARQMMLIFDNIEHLLAGVEVIPDILRAAPGVKMLVTSRERLNVEAEYVYRVQSLDCPEWETPEDAATYSAVKLFMQSARRVQPHFAMTQDNVQEISHICRLVDGMPLGILLAAAWVEVLSLPEIAKEIETNLSFLEIDQRDAPERQRSMRAAFAYSWNLLSEAERDVFKRLSVFRGGFTREAAQHVAGAAIKVLMTLVNKSLLRRDAESGRYDIHELLRQYVQGHLDASVEDRARTHDLHADYYSEYMAQRWVALTTNGQRAALDDIEQEIDNVRAAWRHMIAQRDTAAIRKTDFSLWYYLSLRSQYQEAIELFGQGVSTLREHANDDSTQIALGRLLALLGRFYTAVGSPEKGKTVIEESLPILRRSPNPEDVLVGLEGLAQVGLYVGQLDQSRRAAQEGLELASDDGDKGWFLYWLASSFFAAQDFAEARRIGGESLKNAESRGDLWLKACVCTFVLGRAARAEGDYVEARKRSQQGLQAFEELGQPWGFSVSQWDMGNNAFLQEDFTEAGHFFRESLKTFYAMGQSHLVASMLWDMARLFKAQGDVRRAVHLLLFLQSEPTSPQDMRERAAGLLTIIEASDPASVEAVRREYQETPLADMVKQLLVDGHE